MYVWEPRGGYNCSCISDDGGAHDPYNGSLAVCVHVIIIQVWIIYAGL